MFWLVCTNADIKNMVNATSGPQSNTHTPELLIRSLPLSCSLYLCQHIYLESWCQRLLVRFLVRAMHRAAWCASWRLTHNAACCHPRSFLLRASRPVNEQQIIHTVISQADYHTSLLCRGCVGLFCLICKTNTLPLFQLCPQSSHFSAHVRALFSHPPLIDTNSTYITSLSILFRPSRAGQASPYLARVALHPTHFSNPCLYYCD